MNRLLMIILITSGWSVFNDPNGVKPREDLLAKTSLQDVSNLVIQRRTSDRRIYCRENSEDPVHFLHWSRKICGTAIASRIHLILHCWRSIILKSNTTGSQIYIKLTIVTYRVKCVLYCHLLNTLDSEMQITKHLLSILKYNYTKPIK